MHADCAGAEAPGRCRIHDAEFHESVIEKLQEAMQIVNFNIIMPENYCSVGLHHAC